MSNDPTLFVGGTWNGRRETVDPYLSYVRVPIMPDRSISTWDRPMRLTDCTEYETYVLQHIVGASKSFRVFVISGIGGDELIQRLLAGYSAPLIERQTA